MRQFIFLIFLFCLSYRVQAYDLERAWFKPHLTVNRAPELCSPLLDTYTRHFLSSDSQNPLLMDFSSGERSPPTAVHTPKFVPLDWQKVPQQSSEDLRYVDYRVGDELYTLIREAYSIGWREGYTHHTIVNQPVDSIQPPGDWHSYIEERNLSVLIPREDGKFTYESYHLSRNEKKISAELTNIFESSGSVYFLLKTSGASLNDKRDERYGLYQAKAGGHIELACEIKAEPNQEEIRKAQERFHHLAKFNENIKNMLGTSGNCGTLNSHAGATNRLYSSIELASYRPWFGRWEQGTNGSWEVLLSQWQYYELWNFRIYADFIELKPKVLKEFTEFYLDNYTDDPKTADLLANKGFNLIMSVFNGEPRNPWGTQTTLPLALRKSLLSSNNLSEFQSILSEKNINVRELDQKLKQDGILVFALGRADLMRYLVAEGVDVNKTNEFGKTALMYAAQYNDLESAKLLIELGADLNASTDLPTDNCLHVLANRELTALHYAVRYASKEFINLLLTSGSSIHARDSSSKTPYDYLTNFWGQTRYDKEIRDPYGKANPFLSKSDYQYLEKRLRPEPEAERIAMAVAENREGEEQYRSGNLVAAQSSFKKSVMLDPEFFQAHNNLALTLLKLKQIYASAKTSAQVAGLHKAPLDQRASAFFNLGLACEEHEKQEASGRRYATFTWRYCRKPSINYFLASAEIKATDARRAKIFHLLDDANRHAGRKVCRLNETTFAIRDESDLLFIGDTNSPIAYVGVATPEDRTLEIISKQRSAFGETHFLERWRMNFKNHSGTIHFSPGSAKCFF